jgi:hypothetical protein
MQFVYALRIFKVFQKLFTLIGCRKNAQKINLSKAASCKQFQRQNRRFRVFEAGYWKDFSKLVSNCEGAS